MIKKKRNKKIDFYNCWTAGCMKSVLHLFFLRLQTEIENPARAGGVLSEPLQSSLFRCDRFKKQIKENRIHAANTQSSRSNKKLKTGDKKRGD